MTAPSRFPERDSNDPAVTVAACERVQTSWFRRRAEEIGGEVWADGPLNWIDGPDGLNLMFPRELPAAALRRGINRARELGRPTVGAWLGLDVDSTPLVQAGFERGWSPWWMTAPLAAVAGPADPRVELQHDSTDYRGEHAAYRDQLALTRLEPAFAWYAAAYTHHPLQATDKSVRFAGRAWSFLDTDNLAGIFDMAVWEPFRRRGLGTALLRIVCAAAAEAGAHHACLNATAEGKLLYSTCGFTQIGEGITWWLRLR